MDPPERDPVHGGRLGTPPEGRGADTRGGGTRTEPIWIGSRRTTLSSRDESIAIWVP